MYDTELWGESVLGRKEEYCDRLKREISNIFSKNGPFPTELQAARQICRSDEIKQNCLNLANEMKPIIMCDEKESDLLRSKGNTLFRDPKTVRQAANLYTRAIYYAGKDSPSLALAHGNRAVCLFKLMEYEAAYDDCECALAFNHPKREDILKKQATIAKSLSMVSKCDWYAKKLIRRGPLEEIKGKKIKVLRSENRGRYVVADEPIQPDEIIFADDAVLIAPTSNSKKFNRTFLETGSPCSTFMCDSCGATDIVPFPCYECRAAFYCSVKCRLDHKPTHGFECEGCKIGFFDDITYCHMALRGLLRTFEDILKDLIDNGDSKMLETTDGLWESILKAGKDGGITGLFTDFNHFQKSKDMVTCISDVCRIHFYLLHRCDFLEKTQSIRSKILSSEFDWSPVTVAFLIRLTCQVWYNCITCFQFLETVPFSTFFLEAGMLFFSIQHVNVFLEVSPRISCLNHSCESNTKFEKFGFRTLSRANTLIDKGDEISFSYFDPVCEKKRDERRTYLLENYAFFCKCKACEDPNDSLYMKFNSVICKKEACNTIYAAKQKSCPKCGYESDEYEVIPRMANVLKDSSEKYRGLYKQFCELRPFLPKHSHLRREAALEIVKNFLKTQDKSLHGDKELNSFMLEIAVDLLEATEESYGVENWLYIWWGTMVLDLVALRRKLIGLPMDANYDVRKIKAAFDHYEGKFRAKLETYYRMYIE